MQPKLLLGKLTLGSDGLGPEPSGSTPEQEGREDMDEAPPAWVRRLRTSGA